MAGDQQVSGKRRPGTPGPVSRWFQKKMNTPHRREDAP